jgi:hypothetical protein
MIIKAFTPYDKELVAVVVGNMKPVLDSTPWEYKPVSHSWFSPEPVMAMHYKELCYLPAFLSGKRTWRVIRAEAPARTGLNGLGFTFVLEDFAALFLVKIADLVNWSKVSDAHLAPRTSLRKALIEFYEAAKLLEIAALWGPEKDVRQSGLDQGPEGGP